MLYSVCCLVCSAELQASSSPRSAILFIAMMAPPINTGCVTITAPANMFRVSVWNASTIPLPRPSSGAPRPAANCPTLVAMPSWVMPNAFSIFQVPSGTCDIISFTFPPIPPASEVPKFESVSFCSSLSSEISLLVHS